MEDEKPLETSPAYEANHPEEGLSSPGLATRKVTFQEYEALEQKLLEERRRLEDRYWLDKNLHLFDELLRQYFDNTLPTFSEAVLTYIAKLSNAVHAAFYLYNFDSKQLEASAGYACTVETMARPVFQMGEGLVGQAAKSGEMFFLDNIETQLDSSIGRVNATTLLILPLIFDRSVYGVIELNALSAPSDRILDLLQHLVRNTAVVLQSLSLREQAKKQLLLDLEQSATYQDLMKSLQEKEQKIQALEAQLRAEGSTPSQDLAEAGEELSHPQRAQLETELDSLRLQLRQKEEEIAQIKQQAEVQSQHQDKERTDKVIENLERQLQQTQNQLEILRTELNLAEVEKKPSTSR
ncbi:MAG: GAF domain-containing protein [Microscillaceae bacterium]|nr:GAF domain-containing protein [Microscillaceae bacterium]